MHGAVGLEKSSRACGIYGLASCFKILLGWVEVVNDNLVINIF